MGQDARLESLRTKHENLEHQIEEEENRPFPDQSMLRIKDELNRMPD